MADVFSEAKRSQVMSRIRGRGNKGTDFALAKLLRSERGIEIPASNWMPESSERPAARMRTQFRVASRNITAFYETVEAVEV